MDVLFHPDFDRWLNRLADTVPATHGEVLALIEALRQHGTELADPYSHRVVIATYWIRALRRTPATPVTPEATGPPIIRILYAICHRGSELVAVVLFGGDKTDLQSRWYPPHVRTAEERLIRYCGMKNLRPCPNPREESG